MASRRRQSTTPLRTSKQDVAAAKRAPQTPQTASAAYRLAYADDEFLTSDDTRGVRSVSYTHLTLPTIYSV